MGMMVERRFEIGGWRARRDLLYHDQLLTHSSEIIFIPFLMKSTPDQSVESPGVRDMKTPCGHACLRPALLFY